MPPQDWQPHWFVTCLDIWLGTEVCTEHLMEERQLKIVFPEVRVSSRLEHRPEQFVGCVCVCVTHLILTLKVWPSHAWVHMCELCRLGCLPHTVFAQCSRWTLVQLLCVCETEQDTSKPRRSRAIKKQIRVGQTFALTSDQHINHLSDTHSLICITHLNKRPPDSFFLKQLLFCVLLYEFGG